MAQVDRQKPMTAPHRGTTGRSIRASSIRRASSFTRAATDTASSRISPSPAFQKYMGVPKNRLVRGEGASGQIKVEAIRDARQNIQKSALSSDAEGRVLFIYGAQNLNGASANAMLKIMEEPPEGVMFLLTASSAAAVLPTIRSRCAAYTMAPVPTEECAAALRTAQPELNEQNAQDLAFLYEGHIGLCLKALTDPAAKVARAAARELCRQAQQQDAYRVQALLAGYEKDRDSAAAVLWQATQAASAALRRPGFDGVQPDTAARILRAAEAARRAMKANGNLRLALTVCGMEMAAR